MTLINHEHLLLTWIKITYMAGQYISEYLRYREFEWLKNVDGLDVMSTNEKSDVGYIL